MGVKEQIHSSEYYRDPAESTVEAAQATASTSSTGGPSGGSSPAGMGPVISWEKTDVEFWLQVAQVVLLFLILRDLGGVS